MRSDSIVVAVARMIVVTALVVQSIEIAALATDGARDSHPTAKIVIPARTTFAPPAPPRNPGQTAPLPGNRTAVPQAGTTKKKGFLKWILIGAAAGTATALILAKQKDSAPEAGASLTVGQPVVGQPQ